MLRVAFGVALGLAVSWLALVVALWRVRPADGSIAREAVRLVPDTLRLLRALARDPTVPKGVRIRLWGLLVYLLCPIDLVPDFIPIVGYADDAIVVGVALRSVVRHAGADVVLRHWRGSTEGLAALWRLARLPPES